MPILLIRVPVIKLVDPAYKLRPCSIMKRYLPAVGEKRQLHRFSLLFRRLLESRLHSQRTLDPQQEIQF